MLRRNFLKLLGLLPLGFLPSVKSDDIPVMATCESIIHPDTLKYYARITLRYPFMSFQQTKDGYDLTWEPKIAGSYSVDADAEVELEKGCTPKIMDRAFVSKDGRITNCPTVRIEESKILSNHIYIGIFTSERYTKPKDSNV